jgi:radical SAM superfamily enzyme YgiQ (UPF0313 family)
MRCAVAVETQRRILCVFPCYSPSFGTFSHAYKLLGRVRAFMPPQGLLVIAAYMPARWEVRIVDENIAPATARDFAWADAVFVSGMHVQKEQMRDIGARARAAGRLTVLGGPSVSSTPEAYPDFDVLHIGEVGDATDALVRLIDASPQRPQTQIRLETSERLPMEDFPIPAYDKLPMNSYFIGSLQYSSGCPYRCEFCDIPALYGRQPRLKTPEQVIAELDAIVAAGSPPAIYFVDDNFVGNRKAARELLPHLIAWQERRGFPLVFACEATLNIAKQEALLEDMRRARFDTIFVGIETPELGALKAIDKGHNAAVPLIDSVRTLNRYGMEVVSGIIMGLDTDTPESEAHLIEFVEQSQIPMLTMNLLQALPKTPLWDRLAKEGRILEDPERESNVVFLRPYHSVVATWRRSVARVYDPEKLLGRYLHQVEHTYRHRVQRPIRTQLTPRNLWVGMRLMVQLAFRIGVRSPYSRAYWKLFRHCARLGQIDSALGIGLTSYHLVTFATEAQQGHQNASFYASNKRARAASS